MYSITKKLIEKLRQEIESKLNENNEYKISISDVVKRFDVSVSTAYNVLRILRTYYENDNDSYDVIFAKSELKIKKLK
ncbi:MAG: hypothetical protein QXL82_03150 [Candidatus Aenigmatarchaeota archaeon]